MPLISCSGICNDSIKFQMKRKSIRLSYFPNYWSVSLFSDFKLLFCRGKLRNILTYLSRTCMLIIRVVWWRSLPLWFASHPVNTTPEEWALCSWGHVTTIFLKIFYVMGYNLKNVRNGKNISKIPKWHNLRLLA